MKNKILILPILLLVALVWSGGGVESAECLADLSNAPCDVSSSLELVPNTYVLNDSLQINITASDVFLDLNGSSIIGNWSGGILDEGSGSDTGIYVNNANFILSNGYLHNYKHAIKQRDSGGVNNFTIYNITFNMTFQALTLDRPNNNIYNNTFIDSQSDGIFAEGFDADNNLFENNTFIGGADGIDIGATADNSNNNTIRGNIFYNSFYKHGVHLEQSNNNLIENNTFYNMVSAITSGGLVSNTIIRYNTIYNITNETSNVCGDCKGIDYFATDGQDDNLTIYGNNITDVNVGMSFSNITNSSIYSNYITNSRLRAISLSTQESNNFSSNIFTNASEIRLSSLTGLDGNITTIFNNIFNNINPYFNLFSGTGNILKFEFNGNYGNFTTINQTGNGNGYIDFYSLTNALIYNTNGSIYGSSNINSNDGNINITLPPNNASYVLDNYKLNESETRANNPLSITGTTTTKTITSSLADTINATGILSIGSTLCRDITGVSYQSTGVDFNCSDATATITLNLNNIPNGASTVTISSGPSQYSDLRQALRSIMGGFTTFGTFFGTIFSSLGVYIILGIFTALLILILALRKKITKNGYGKE